MSLADSVKNGPQVTSAKVAHIEAQIGVHEARARKAQDAATAHRRRATGDGPLAKARRIRADAQATVADRHRAKANKLRTDLAKAKADEAARHARHVKRTVASTAAAGLTPIAAGQGGQGGRANRPAPAKAGPASRPTQAKGGQPASRPRSTGGIWQDPPVTGTVCENVDPRCTYCGQRTSKPVTNWRGEVACPKHVKFLPEEPKPWTPPENQCGSMVERKFPRRVPSLYGSSPDGMSEPIGSETRAVRCSAQAAAGGQYCGEHQNSPGPLTGGGCRGLVRVRPPGLDLLLRHGMGHPDDRMDAPCPNKAGPDGFCDTHRTITPEAAPAPTKGTPAMTVSGEAVNIETTEAMLADLKTRVADMRATFDNAGGSLASAGLNKLANALSKADDALGSVDTGIVDAARELAPHKDIADIAQSTGEMANNSTFYGV